MRGRLICGCMNGFDHTGYAYTASREVALEKLD
jgi:hypothetical protein